MAKTAAERQAAARTRKRQDGLKPHEIWLTAKELRAVKALLKAMRGDKT